MQTTCFKGHGGLLQNPNMQPAPLSFSPWWSVNGSTPQIYGESFGQLKSVDLSSGHDQTSAAQGEVTNHVKDQGKEKLSRKESKAQQLPTAISLLSSPPEHQAYFGLGLVQPMVFTNNAYMDQHYGLYPSYGAQTKNGRLLLPLNMTEDGAIYVNAKQYHRILQRRKSRAKLEMENKMLKRKPYLHESRHQHALRRPRGCGGRFLNTKSGNAGKRGSLNDKAGHGHVQVTGSTSSESFQSDSRNINSEIAISSGSNQSGSEVTSIYSQGDIDHFQIEHLRSSDLHPFTDTPNRGTGGIITIKWASADRCCGLLKA